MALIENYLQGGAVCDYICGICKTKSVFENREIICYPKILCLQLSRFTNNLTKIHSPVDIPKALCFNNCISYILKAICRHHGNSITHGHYTSDVYQSNLCKWVQCDDKECKFINITELKNDHTAYMLFYELSEN